MISMWGTIISSVVTVLLFFAKIIMERIAGKKLSDAEFVEHVKVHQEKRKNTAKQTTDFEQNMQDAYDELNQDQKQKSNAQKQ